MKLFMKRNRRVLVFTTVVMLFLVGVGVIQLVVNQYRPLKDTAVVKVEDNKDKDTDKEDPQAPAEKMVKPVGDDIKIVKKFYDSSLSDEELEKALVYFEGVYRPNLGIDFSKDNKAFEVTAAFSGTVTKKDNVFSNVLKYADIKQPVYITLLIDEDIENLGLTIKNTKKHSANYIESNQIGLKSVQQMIKIHDGTFTVLDEESTFTVSITIPLMQ